MSTTIDQRVVEMRFDNKQFEANVQTSLSTLEKLKQKLNLTGASKGLENISAASKNNNVHLLGNAVEQVGLKFNAMYTIADQTLRNITNSVERTAKNMVSALTIDPIKTGLSEYETQINAVQTIMANTSHNGTTLTQVNSALDELNTYADKTIYNFTEMTRNIGTFTAAGVDLQTSVESIQGIANLAAVSGSTSQQASTAMYQLSQALAAGKVSLMDWNSVVNAGMGGKVFQDALIRTSELMKTGAKDAIKTHGSFRESLTKGEWLTTEVLTETLKQISGAYSEAELVAQGFTKEQAKEIAKLAETAGDAATKVKTFTQLWDTLKEAAQSGWTQTWEILIGDFEEAKELWTGVSDTIGEFINGMSEARNTLLAGALNTPWEKLVDSINKAGIETSVFEDKVTKIAKDNGIDMDALVKKYGSFEDACRSGAISSDILKEALNGLGSTTADLTKVTDELKMGSTGDQVKEVQQALSDLGYDFSKFGVDGIIGSETETAIKAFQELQGLEVTGVVDEKTLEALKSASSEADSLKGSFDDLIDSITAGDLGGRELAIEGLKNAFTALKMVIKPIGTAFRNIFPKASSENIYNIISAFTEFTKKLKPSGTTIGNIRKTFEGFFAVLDIGWMLLKAVASGIAKVFGGGNLSGFAGGILDITANIGEFIKSMRDALKEGNVFGSLADIIAAGIRKILDILSIPADIIAGFINGLLDGGGGIVSAAIEFVGKFLNTIKDLLGIHSPSTETYDIATNCILGLVNGIKAGIKLIVGAVGDIVSTIIDALGGLVDKVKTSFSNSFGDIDWNKIFTGTLAVAIVTTIKKVVNIFGAFAKPLEGLGDMFGGVGEVLGGVSTVLKKSAKSISKVIKSASKIMNTFNGVIKNLGTGAKKYLNAKAFEARTEGIKNLAIAIGILAAAMVALSLVNPAKLQEAAVSLTMVIVAMGGLAYAVSKMTDSMTLVDSVALVAMGSMLLKLGVAVLLLGVTMKLIGDLDDAALIKGLAAISLFMLFMKGFAEIGAKSGKNAGKVGSMLLKLSVSLLILVGVIKLIAKLTPDEMKIGVATLVIFGLFVGILSKVVAKDGKHADKLGSMILKITVAMLLLVAVIKLVGAMSFGELATGVVVMAAFTLFVKAMIWATKDAKGEMPKIAGILLAMSLCIGILALVIKLLSSIKFGGFVQGLLGVTALTGIMYLLIKMVKSVGNQQTKIAATLIAMSASIAILAGVAVILGLIDLRALAKGVTAVSILGLVMAAMVKSLKGAQNVKGSIIAMTVAIGVMAVAVAALSNIEFGKLASATASLGILMGMFALIARSAKNIKNSWGTLLVMTAAVAVLAGVIYLIAKLPVQQSIGAATALSVLMLAMSVSLMIISKSSGNAMAALPAMGILLAIVSGLALILGIMEALNVSPSIETAITLSTFLLAMSVVTFILSKVGSAGSAAIAGAAIMMAVIAVIGAIAMAIGGLMSLIPPDLIASWKTGLQDFMDFITILAGGIGDAIGAFVGGVIGGSIDAFSESLNKLGDTVLSFGTKISGLDSTMIDSVASLGTMILAITASSILDGIATFITGTSSIDTFGTQLESFGKSIVSFSSTVSGNIDEGAVTAAANAGLIMTTLANEVPNTGGLLGWIMGDNDLDTFGTQLEGFGKSIVKFSSTVSGNVDEGAATAAANAGSVMAAMASELPNTGGLLGWITGENDMDNFGTQLVGFGNAIVTFSDTVSSGTINQTAVDAAANAGSVMAAMASELPNTGGLLGWITGENNMDDFGTQLEGFGSSIMKFADAVSGGTIDQTAVDAAANAGSVMAAMATDLPNTGGLLGWLMGDNDMATFGEQMVAFGEALVDFSDTVSGNIDSDAITAAGNAGTIMSSLQTALPEEHWFDGKMNLEDFGGKLQGFGEGIKDFSDEIKDIDATAISTATSTARRLATLASDIVDLDTSGIDDFKDIKDIGEAIYGFGSYVSMIDPTSVSSVITSANRLKNLINSLAELDTSGISAFSTAIEDLSDINLSDLEVPDMTSLGSGVVDNIVSGLNSKKSTVTSAMTSIIGDLLSIIDRKKAQFKIAGLSLMNMFASSLKTASSKISSIISSSIALAVMSMRLQYYNMYSAGRYLGEGLVIGIDSKKKAAYDAGYALGQAAVKGEKDGQKSKSPSRLTMQAGKWLGEGLIIGMDRMVNSVYSSGKNLGQTAARSMTSTVSKIASAINTDIDSQPTIRPVLDLSGVEASASTIGGLFSDTSIGVNANLNAISSMMNNKNQNGTNSDVVSAIDKLSERLSNIGGNNYNINGVSYSDDANVANAIQTLVRATVVEGRA